MSIRPAQKRPVTDITTWGPTRRNFNGRILKKVNQKTPFLNPFSTDDFKTSRLQDFIRNFQKNIFTSVLAPQIAVASLGEPRMIRKENNCN